MQRPGRNPASAHLPLFSTRFLAFFFPDQHAVDDCDKSLPIDLILGTPRISNCVSPSSDATIEADMVIVITGVTGSGKTTVGKLLARRLQWKFYEGDDFHPPVNIEKLKRGTPLDDEDRLPWLTAIRDTIRAAIDRSENAVVACSALKESYRRMLRIGPEVVLIHLEAKPELVEERLTQRTGHFMNPTLVRSQFDTLEKPWSALEIDAGLTPGEIVNTIRDRLSL